MKTTVFLVVGAAGTVKVLKSRPSLSNREVSIALALSLPDALFTNPTLSAQISIPKESVQVPKIDAVVEAELVDAIRRHTGMEVELVLKDDREPTDPPGL